MKYLENYYQINENVIWKSTKNITQYSGPDIEIKSGSGFVDGIDRVCISCNRLVTSDEDKSIVMQIDELLSKLKSQK